VAREARRSRYGTCRGAVRVRGSRRRARHRTRIGSSGAFRRRRRIVDGRAALAALALRSLEMLEVKLLLPDHLQETVHLCLLLRLQLLVQFSEAHRSVATRVSARQEWRPGEGLGAASSMTATVRHHFPRSRKRRVIHLNVRQDDRLSTARMR